MASTTYTIPSGLSLRQKKAMAALLACAPCCGSGSGGGSGNWWGDGGCCGCGRAIMPTTLTFTVDASCTGLGSRTLTLDAQGFFGGDPVLDPQCGQFLGALPAIDYIGYYDGGIGSGTATDCVTGTPALLVDVYDDYTVATVGCYSCRSSGGTPLSKHWRVNFFWQKIVSGVVKTVEWIALLEMVSCNPVLFNEISGTVTCSDDVVCDDTINNNGVPCLDNTLSLTCMSVSPKTDYTPCVGSTVTINISE